MIMNGDLVRIVGVPLDLSTKKPRHDLVGKQGIVCVYNGGNICVYNIQEPNKDRWYAICTPEQLEFIKGKKLSLF